MLLKKKCFVFWPLSVQIFSLNIWFQRQFEVEQKEKVGICVHLIYGSKHKILKILLHFSKEKESLF
jgi:hypothetical protein